MVVLKIDISASYLFVNPSLPPLTVSIFLLGLLASKRRTTPPTTKVEESTIVNSCTR